jgi:hypothetical protein
MNEKKVVNRNWAIAIGVLCIILIIGLVITESSYTSILNSKNSNILSLNNQIASLNTQIESDKSTITSLNSQVSNLNSQINNLQSQSGSSSSQNTNLQNQINSLNAQITQLNLYISNIASLHNGTNGVYLSNTQISNYYGTGLNWGIDANTTINNLLGSCTVTLTFITKDYTFSITPSSSVTVTMHWEAMFQEGVNLSIKSVSR